LTRSSLDGTRLARPLSRVLGQLRGLLVELVQPLHGLVHLSQLLLLSSRLLLSHLLAHLLIGALLGCALSAALCNGRSRHNGSHHDGDQR
jgi:hypothetical protein